MPTGLDSVTVVNAALEQIAAQTQITSLGDGSPAANAASVVYSLTVELLLRILEPDFARLNASLVTLAGTPPPRWAYQYTLPADCLRLLQVTPTAAVVAGLDPNDPQPTLFGVNMTATPAAVVFTDQGAGALATYISSAITEAQWDSAFADTVVRRLANPLAMALSGRPDFARELLEQAIRSEQSSHASDDSMVRA